MARRSVERMSPFAAAALRLLLFTGCRVSEILELRWEHVDAERGLLFLPDSKTGRKTIVLNAPALAILAELPRIPGNPHVICGQKPGAAIARGRPVQATCNRSGRVLRHASA